MTDNSPIPFKKFIPGIAWFLLILVLISIPGEDIPSPKFLLDLSFDKIVHMGLFGMLVVLFFLPVSRSPFSKKQQLKWLLLITVAAIGYGYGTELMQRYFIRGRSYDLVDWAADSLGAILAFAFCRWKMI